MIALQLHCLIYTKTLFVLSLINVFVCSMAVKLGEERLKEMEAEMALWVQQLFPNHTKLRL